MDPDRNYPPLFFEAREDYERISRMARVHLVNVYSDKMENEKSWRRVEDALKAELRMILLRIYNKSDMEKEIRDSVWMFYNRERGERRDPEDFNLYVRTFLDKHTPQFKHFFDRRKPQDFKEAFQTFIERITPPWPGPYPVLEGWLWDQCNRAISNLPAEVCGDGGISKILRVTMGTFLFALTDLADDTSEEAARERIDFSYKTGFFYGYLHPLVDDLLDSSLHLTDADKKQMVQALNYWIGGDYEYGAEYSSNPVMAELLYCLKSLFGLFPESARPMARKLLYLLHFSQADDSNHFDGTHLSWPDFYVPVVIKASLSRILADHYSGRFLDSIDTIPVDTGLILQLMDDIRDFKSDLQHSVVTGFTAPLLTNGFNCPSAWGIYLRAMDQYMGDDEYSATIRFLIMRRIVISLKNTTLMPGDRGYDSFMQEVGKVSPRSFRMVSRILRMKLSMPDPDRELFKPIDSFFSQ